jgi:hypothetical protein
MGIANKVVNYFLIDHESLSLSSLCGELTSGFSPPSLLSVASDR